VVATGDRLERVQPAPARVVQSEGHAADSKAGTLEAPIAGWTRPIESALGWGCRLPQSTETEPNMEVLRWLLFFAIAMFLIVAGIFFVLGRDLPIPSF
jgi:hypothetical protein